MVVLADVVVRGSVGQAVLIAPWLLLGLWIGYVVWYASALRTDAAGITVQNLLRRTTVPWGRVAGIELRWQIEVRVDDGSVVRSLGGAVPTRRSRRAPASAADAATAQAGLLIDDWSAAAGGAGESDAATAPVRRSWDLPALAALAVIAVWAGAAVLVAGS